MAVRFVHKIFAARPNGRIVFSVGEDSSKDTMLEAESTKKNNKKEKKSSEMNTKEQFDAAEAIMDDMALEVKVVKKDRGLIERTESSKIILTEDNRQVLND